MSVFIDALKDELNTTETLNGAKAYKSTLNSCLDLFGKVAASRNNIDNARRLFLLACNEDLKTAIHILFWVRDVRGGQGEREVFRALFKELVTRNVSDAKKVLEYVPYYGRWDDLLILEDTKLWPDVLQMIKTQLNSDLNSEEAVSLLGKWLPSINASSKESKRIGRKIAEYLGYSEKQYRKTLVNLREKIRIVETKMCSNQWESIEYDKIPSRAGYMYRKAFAKHDPTGYSQFLTAVENGEKKINAGTIYPYEIVQNYLYGGETNDQTLNLMWESLPNYMEDNPLNGLVVADVSGSMSGTPMSVSISLAMYIAERNTGIWKNKFLTFSSEPQMMDIVGNTIAQRIRYLHKAPWGGSTNIQAVFDLILNTALKNKISDDDMPKKLIIVSDMQFNNCVSYGGSVSYWNNPGPSKTNFETMRDKYEKSGYTMPDLIFWNVNDIGGNVPMKMHDSGTCLVSGCSPSILKSVLANKMITPIDVMNDTIYSDRYQVLSKALSE